MASSRSVVTVRFCDLIAHTPLNLERNVSPEAVRRYKLAGSLWQIANPAPAVAELYASDPALAQACVDLAPGCGGPRRSCWPG